VTSPRKASVLSRFRLAGAGVLIGVGLVGAIFYGLVNSHYVGLMLGRTLGPYTDTLATAGFESEDPEIWRKIAERHGVAILLEPRSGDRAAWNENGAPVPPRTLAEGEAPVRGVRTSSDGTRVTFHWTLGLFPGNHVRTLGALLLMMLAVVGAAFWFLQRQLEPLARLQTGVEAVARGDFETRVPVVREDEIGRVAASFNEMAGRVGEMVEDRERLLADVSHELRSPIARMKVALELMPEGDKRESLDRDLREMEELISALLDREALAARTGRLAVEPVDLAKLSADVATALGSRPPGVEAISDGPVTIEADPLLVRMLLQNVVDNAIKFSLSDSRAVKIAVERRQGGARVRVRDDGVGIPPGSEERVFEPFTKLDRARGHRSGHGLGLNLCQRIARLHGGAVEIRPAEPRGSEVVVELPSVPRG
jgi:signal transduction histidine kinase